MRTLIASLLIALATAAPLHAQQTPFDMSPERPPVGLDPDEAGDTAPDEEAQDEPEPEAAEPVAESEFRRHILPGGDLTLWGETAARGWALHLTGEQAAAAARLHLGYRNAVVVAPESSRIQLLVNGTIVASDAIRSVGGEGELILDLPQGLLRAGRNDILLRLRQRHRTDCTIASTYELWTRFESADSYLSLTGPAVSRISAVEELRTLAPDGSGTARIAIVAPGMTQGDISAEIVRIAQAVALHVGLPNIEFSVSSELPENGTAETLRVLAGSAGDLGDLAVELPRGISAGPVASVMAASEGLPPTLVISGRDRADWTAAIANVLGPVDRAAGMREALVTEAWRLPNATMAYGARDLSFAELGIRSEQFSGRRYSAGFQFALPSDFYAGSYGEATILLDAAYSGAVRPDSRINVYVNGSIAVSVPLSSQRGAVLNRFPAALTMRHFQPGLNEVRIEAELDTAQDEVCLPGTTGDDTARFALFDTSRLVIPDFARIAQRPDLAALSGTAFPYGLASEPVMVVAERNDPAILSSAATIFARMALSAGRAIPATFTATHDMARAQDAIFIGAINDMPAGVLAQMGVGEDTRTVWAASLGRAPAAGTSDAAEVEAWRRELQGSGRIEGRLRAVSDWFTQTFDLTLDMLRFAPAADTAFTPSTPALVMVAQGSSPQGDGAWTLLTAPDTALLREGAASLARQDTWRRLAGHLSTLQDDLVTVEALPVSTTTFIETQPRSFANLRLVVANWLSANILSYSLLLIVACVLLGVATSALLSQLGRR